MIDRKNGLTYADSGVDIDAGNRLVDLIKPMVRATAPRRRGRRDRRLRRAVRPQGRGLQGSGAGGRHRRRRHQGQDRDRDRPAWRDRHRSGGDVGQRPRGAGRGTAVLPRLFRLRQARSGSDGCDRRRRRRRLPRKRLRPDRRRDRRNARPLQGRRLRPRRLCGRRRRTRHAVAAARISPSATP